MASDDVVGGVVYSLELGNLTSAISALVQQLEALGSTLARVVLHANRAVDGMWSQIELFEGEYRAELERWENDGGYL